MRLDLARRPEEFPAVFQARFNARALDALIEGYAEDAVLVLGRKDYRRGRAEIRQALEDFLAPGLPMRATLRSHQQSEGDAMVTFDWSIEGTSADGAAVKMGGIATDVLRRGPDGFWRQVLDYPFGPDF